MHYKNVPATLTVANVTFTHDEIVETLRGEMICTNAEIAEITQCMQWYATHK